MAATFRALFVSFAAALVFSAPAHAALTPPSPLSPAAGAVVESVPPFAWTPVAGADHYEFQISADSGFNSPVLGRTDDDFATKNTRATLLKTIPNATYWWRVRSVTQDGAVSAWSGGRSFRKAWTAAAALQSPSGGTSLSFGTDPLKLLWSQVPGASHYLVSVATDPSLGSLAFHFTDDPNGPPQVQANSLAMGAAMAPGTYFWSVTPIDAEGNRGSPSPVASFNWLWPSSTTPRVVDLNSAPEVYDPLFSWDPVPGAARYQVEINSSSDFAPGSKVCCDALSIATSIAPTAVFKDNTYYWRVRALDPDGNAGVWNVGPSFTKTFDNVPTTPDPAVKNLHLRDNLADPGVDQSASAGYQTTVPIVSWDPVPGAASYEVEIAPWDGTACLWATANETVKTAVPSWTPIGWTMANPVAGATLTTDGDVTPGQYCTRVRARSDRVNSFDEVYGDWTYLDPDGLGWAFDWTGLPSGDTAGCSGGYICASDYLGPQTGTTVGRTPLFTWHAMTGKQSYYVVVAKDPSFGTIVDEAFTNVPAYAPRGSFGPATYSDETTLYYWAVLPATSADGHDAVGNLLLAHASNFQKQSTPPALLAPAPGTLFFNQPTFRWTPAEGARKYRLQVSQDPSFGNPIDDVTTDSTAYSSNTTYPADTVLYWRVRADDENGVGLTWSATGTFQKKLAAPVPSASNPVSGEFLPVWAWAPVDGAVSYDVSIDQPDGQTRDFQNFREPAVSFEKLTGTGVFHWRVRAEFPKQSYGSTPGPWSATMPFTRVIGEPTGAHTDGAPDHLLLSWNSKLGVKDYRVEISSRPDFSTTVESVETDNTSYAPKLQDIAYLNGGALYWRVAGMDEDRNVGDFTQAQPISLLPQLKMSVSGKLRRRRWSRVTVRVTTASGSALQGASVRVLGAGVRRQTKKTGLFGTADFRLRPTRKGRVLFSVSKGGFQSAGRVLYVR